MKKKIYMATAVLAAVLLSGCAKESDVQRYAWPLATSSPEDTVTQLFSEKFAEEVDRLSDGKMKIQVYPNSTLGGDRESLESCKDGDIPFVVQNTAPQVTFMKEILSNDSSAFGNACANTSIGNPTIAKIRKNNIILPTDSYRNPKIFIIEPPTRAITETIPKTTATQIIKPKKSNTFFLIFHAFPNKKRCTRYTISTSTSYIYFNLFFKLCPIFLAIY